MDATDDDGDGYDDDDYRGRTEEVKKWILTFKKVARLFIPSLLRSMVLPFFFWKGEKLLRLTLSYISN